MLARIRNFFEQKIAEPERQGEGEAHDHALRLAAAALLIEISRADTEITPDERDTIVDSIQKVFDLEQAETVELVALAETEVDEAVSLYQFTQLVDGRFTPAEKKKLVELLWRVSFADGEVDKYEEHLIRRIAELLHVPHGDFTHAKHRAQERF